MAWLVYNDVGDGPNGIGPLSFNCQPICLDALFFMIEGLNPTIPRCWSNQVKSHPHATFGVRRARRPDATIPGVGAVQRLQTASLCPLTLAAGKPLRRHATEVEGTACQQPQ